LDQQNDRVPTPVIVARADHPVSRRMISGNALKVLYRLKEGGYQAFLVGGCVRDLLIGIEPKDFDVATDASPEEMRRLFPQLPPDRPTLPACTRPIRAAGHRGRDFPRGGRADIARGHRRSGRRARRGGGCGGERAGLRV
jgi:hypothetical protein